MFTLDSTLVALLIGDVSGKGLAAAASTAEIKYALRAFARESLEPKITLERLNNFMCEARQHGDWDANIFAVLSLVMIDPSTGQGFLALAGAEPALLRRVSGEIEQVEPSRRGRHRQSAMRFCRVCKSLFQSRKAGVA